MGAAYWVRVLEVQYLPRPFGRPAGMQDLVSGNGGSDLLVSKKYTR